MLIAHLLLSISGKKPVDLFVWLGDAKKQPTPTNNKYALGMRLCQGVKCKLYKKSGDFTKKSSIKYLVSLNKYIIIYIIHRRFKYGLEKKACTCSLILTSLQY